jgi:ASC-1-like (ASCH) protein
MTTWESGRESQLLDDIIAGRKTIEGRLNKGKFSEYRVGDKVWLRRDHRDENGILRDGESHTACVEVVAIRHYQTFLEMTTNEGYKSVIPNAISTQEAADEYNAFYSAEDQAHYGVLAIEIRYLKSKV